MRERQREGEDSEAVTDGGHNKEIGVTRGGTKKERKRQRDRGRGRDR